MFKRCLILLSLIALLLTGTAFAANSKSPYAIKVNIATNTVTIYTQDETGDYTIPYKAMVCSTARPGHTTPQGSFTLQTNRHRWLVMVDGTYGQYATRFKGHYLFHSICYTDDVNNAMIRDAYNNLGNPASMGCVRLQTIDAKWIYDNCPGGTNVTIYSDPNDLGPLGKPDKLIDYISEAEYNGWDPTDPAAGNPWRNAVSVTMESQTLTLTAGQSTKVTASIAPKTADLYWKSSDPTVAVIHTDGTVIALSAGTAEIMAYAQNDLSATCTVQVEGELLPFDDLIPGAWYYSEIRQVLEKGLLGGIADRIFAPNTPATRAEVVQAIYHLEGQPKLPRTAKSTFTDVSKEYPCHNAVVWAVSQGIVQGTSETEFCPDRAMTRQELSAVLWRYAGKPAAETDLNSFADAGYIQTYAHDALSWAVSNHILKGSDNKLHPHMQVTRAETAAILQRLPMQK